MNKVISCLLVGLLIAGCSKKGKSNEDFTHKPSECPDVVGRYHLSDSIDFLAEITLNEAGELVIQIDSGEPIVVNGKTQTSKDGQFHATAICTKNKIKIKGTDEDGPLSGDLIPTDEGFTIKVSQPKPATLEYVRINDGGASRPVPPVPEQFQNSQQGQKTYQLSDFELGFLDEYNMDFGKSSMEEIQKKSDKECASRWTDQSRLDQKFYDFLIHHEISTENAAILATRYDYLDNSEICRARRFMYKKRAMEFLLNQPAEEDCRVTETIPLYINCVSNVVLGANHEIEVVKISREDIEKAKEQLREKLNKTKENDTK